MAVPAIIKRAGGDPLRPNIILCMSDDQGWGDVGYNGHTELQTPHLDRMARQGLRFDRFYSGSSVCSPTRGSCLTGRNANRFGVYHANVGHLRQQEVTIAEVLRAHGYATGHFGKWHLGTLSRDARDGRRGGVAVYQAAYSPLGKTALRPASPILGSTLPSSIITDPSLPWTSSPGGCDAGSPDGRSMPTA